MKKILALILVLIGLMVQGSFAEEKICDMCGKKMIQVDTGIVLTSYPPQHSWFWKCFGCGNIKEGGIRRGETYEELKQKEWEKINTNISQSKSNNYVVEYDGLEKTITKYEVIEVKRNLADVMKEQEKQEQMKAIERALEKREHYKGAENLYKWEGR